MRTLKGNTWLSDPAINGPLYLLKKRSDDNRSLIEKNLTHDESLLKIRYNEYLLCVLVKYRRINIFLNCHLIKISRSLHV